MQQTTFQKGSPDVLLEYPLVEIPETSAGLVDPHIGIANGVPEPIRPGDPLWENQVHWFNEARGDVAYGSWPKSYLREHSPDGKSKLAAPFEGIVDTSQPETACNLVHMDAPDDLGAVLFDYIWENGGTVRETGQSKYSRHNEYLNAVTVFKALLTPNLHDAYHDFMGAKYYHGLVRPEEYFGLRGCIVTSYAEGCPAHPAFPAGHATFAGKTLIVLRAFFKLPKWLDEIVELACWQFAHFRTFAGVHWTQDNDLGLLLGQARIRRN